MSESEAAFIPGLELSRRFFAEAVTPLLERNFPRVRCSAALLGAGSEVLGYDTPRSRDHDWGPRLQLFLDEQDQRNLKEALYEMLREQLPKQFLGYSTHFGPPDEEGTRLMAEPGELVDHRVQIWTVPQFFEDYMAYDPRQKPSVLEWLTWPQQHLLGVTAGAVFRDDLGDLNTIRKVLDYYPHDVWLYLLAAQWARIGQEEHFVGRTGEVGDEIGSALLAARLVQDIMQLCFLMERRYFPYPKWFGTAFAHLDCADTLSPLLQQVLTAQNWHDREGYLSQAYETVAQRHNSLGITEQLDPQVRYFHDRPFLVIDAGRYVDAIRDQISDPQIAAIKTNIGSIDQFSHSTDLRSYPKLHKSLQSLYK
ncbi:MAG: DUF4037 domain-containing protein [Candidatus Promineifilaceae bacterium]